MTDGMREAYGASKVTPTAEENRPSPETPTPRPAPMIHDGGFITPRGCPRNRTDCEALARVASPGFASFMCCGETASAPVPSDRLRLCIVSTHNSSPVDVLVNIDERDATDTSLVLLGGLSILAHAKVDRAVIARYYGDQP